jgi:hypothetical protein
MDSSKVGYQSPIHFMGRGVPGPKRIRFWDNGQRLFIKAISPIHQKANGSQIPGSRRLVFRFRQAFQPSSTPPKDVRAMVEGSGTLLTGGGSGPSPIITTFAPMLPSLWWPGGPGGI